MVRESPSTSAVSRSMLTLMLDFGIGFLRSYDPERSHVEGGPRPTAALRSELRVVDFGRGDLDDS